MSCDKDDSDGNGGGLTVSGKVENASQYSDVVKVKAKVWDSKNDEDIEIAEAEFKTDGSFSIKLPEKVDANYLSAWDDEDIPSTVTVSNRNAKTSYLSFEGVDKNGNHVSWLYYGILMGDDDSGAYVDYIYSDSDCSITGTYSDNYYGDVRNEAYALILKKGWNITYASSSKTSDNDGNYIRNSTFSSAPITGLKWYGRYDWDW